MKQFLGIVMAVLVGCAGAQSHREYNPITPPNKETVLVKNNELRVIIHAPNTSGLPRTGSPIDRELSLIELFARSHKLTLKFVPVMHRSELFDALLNGHGDLIAAQLTHTAERAKRMQFSAPIRYVSEQVVVAKNTKRFPKNSNELAKHGRKQGAIWVQPGSSFVETIQRLSARLGQSIHVTHIDQSLTTDELLYRVASGQYAISVADSNSVEAYMSYRNDLKVAFTLKEQVPTAWAIHPQNTQLLTAINRFITYNVSPQRSAQIALGDLPEIKKRGRLRVGMPNNAASYFLHGGMPIGYQYRLAKRFAKELGVRLEVIIPRRQMDLIALLTSGHVDMLAATLTITPERQKKMAFSDPLTVVDEVLVQRANDPSITRIEYLAGHQIQGNPGSSAVAQARGGAGRVGDRIADCHGQKWTTLHHRIRL
ncbi:MAG TPA: transporter substrate-binding domain-containing protein [Myxococcales bacterium]|nr:transporter substrate-binding domain-containing protein [Myxococcales bacterium]